MTSEVSPIKASTGAARGIMYLELIPTFLIPVLLLFVLLTTMRERYKQDLDGVVDELKSASDQFMTALERDFGGSISAAELWLVEFNNPVITWCLNARYGEERAKQICARPQNPIPSSEGDVRMSSAVEKIDGK